MTRTQTTLISIFSLALVIALLIGPSLLVGAAEDNRLNHHSASPVVFYCTETGIGVYTPDGDHLMTVPTATIDSVGVPAAGQTSITADMELGLYFYRMADGSYKASYINSARGELFTIQWKGCNPGGPAEITVTNMGTGELLSNASGYGQDGLVETVVTGGVTGEAGSSCPQAECATASDCPETDGDGNPLDGCSFAQDQPDCPPYLACLYRN